jgi:hypothetical protein
MVASLPSHSQTPSLLSLGADIVNSIQLAKPEWKYETVSPIKVSGDEVGPQELNPDVILQQWSFENQSVRIAVVTHRSASDAAEAIQNLTRGSQREAFEGGGEGAVTWGRGTVSFRKRNLTVNVTAVIIEPTSDAAEAGKHEPDERKLSKEFARLVAKAIKD